MKQRTGYAPTLVTAGILAGCMINPIYLPGQYSTARLEDGRFEIRMAYSKLEELGGRGSAQLDSFVRSAVIKEGLCPDGFSVSDPRAIQGYVSIVGYCRAASKV